MKTFIQKSLRKLAKVVSPHLYRQIDQLENRLSRIESMHPSIIERAARFVACEMIEGDYLEFGVYRGSSFCRAYQAISKAFSLRIAQKEGGASLEQQQRRMALWEQMRFFAFDSFEGLPPLKGLDTLTEDFAEGQYAASQEELRQAMDSAEVDAAKVKIVPGWFDQTCNQQTWDREALQKAAIVWIDGDLYDSARAVLSGITPLLQDGTIIIFDDWFTFRGNPDLGEQKAFYEWLETLSDFQAVPFHKEGTWRNSFIMSRKVAH